jgi:N-carbamoyl-L-amino-acid hydrolase
VIPGRCELSLDIRSGDDAIRRAAFDEVIAECARIASRRKVRIQSRKVLEIDAVACDARMQAQWSASIARVTGVPEPRRLPSGAGHDAMMMACLAPMGMLFVRCGNGGVSHNPAESLDPADAERAAWAFHDFLTHFSL